MRPKPFRALGAIVAATFLGSCAVTDPSPVRFTMWTLSSVDGVALPFDYPTRMSVRVNVIADTLVMREDGTGSRISVTEVYHPVAPADRERWREESGFTWSGINGQLTARYRCEPDSWCPEGPHLTGTIDESELVLSTDAVAGLAPARYVRIVDQ